MKQVELLAPAGTYEVFRAVLHAGADAVYLAGDRFGARAYAGNFSEEELLRAIDEAHLFGKKIYLTVNTLLKNQELNKALYDYLRPLYAAGLDGVIVQDYGVMKLIHDRFPQMEIHASTQMTITNMDYIPFLRSMNVTRIVPARELSLPEIQKLHEQSGMELECFIHGALCYCYSGACFMSSFIGGRSGNRGRCAQPCRLLYEVKGKKGAFLSLKDLCTLDLLPELIEHGVYSMKIEGRMKSAEYAAGVTEIYRKYIDAYLQDPSGYMVDPADREHLLWLFDRGGLTEGYYRKHNGKNMIALPQKSDKSQEAKKRLEERIRAEHVTAEMKRKVYGSVTLLKNQYATMTLALSEDPEYSVTVQGMMVQMAQKRAMTRQDILKQIEKFGGTFFEPEHIDVTMEDNIFIPNSALNELRRSAADALTECCLRRCRRAEEKEPAAAVWKETEEAAEKGGKPKISVRVLKLEQAKAALSFPIDRIVLESEWMKEEELYEAVKLAKAGDVECFLGMPRIIREGYASFLYNTAPRLLQEGLDGFLIRSAAQVETARGIWKDYETEVSDDKKRGLKLIADYTCYAMNNAAAKAVLSYGGEIVSQVCPVELNEQELRHLTLKNPELLVYGTIPLMVSANCIDRTTHACHAPKEGFAEIKDRKNARLPVLCCCRYCYNLIYNSVPIYLLDKKASLEELHPSYLGFSFVEEEAHQVREILAAVQEAKEPVTMMFTRGHFTRGVE